MTRYRFGLYEFDTETLELRREDRPVPLQGQPARLLALLVERAGVVVSREEMAEHLWDEDRHVDRDEGLSYCIKHLRSAFGDRADNPCFVQNVPRRGYRFIAPIAPVGEPAPSPNRAAHTHHDVLTWLRSPWIRNAVWFVLILAAAMVFYVIYEDWPR